VPLAHLILEVTRQYEHCVPAHFLIRRRAAGCVRHKMVEDLAEIRGGLAFDARLLSNHAAIVRQTHGVINSLSSDRPVARGHVPQA